MGRKRILPWSTSIYLEIEIKFFVRSYQTALHFCQIQCCSAVSRNRQAAGCHFDTHATAEEWLWIPWFYKITPRWKNQAWMPPSGKIYLTPENNLILPLKSLWSFYRKKIEAHHEKTELYPQNLWQKGYNQQCCGSHLRYGLFSTTHLWAKRNNDRQPSPSKYSIIPFDLLIQH